MSKDITGLRLDDEAVVVELEDFSEIAEEKDL
jgi:hypothetical protein